MYANTEIPNSIVQCVEVTRAVRQGTSCFVLSLLSQKQNWLFFYALDRLISQTTIFLNYFIFPYVCAVYVCHVHMHTLMRVHSACVCRCREQRRCRVSPSLILCIITLRQGFSLDLFLLGWRPASCQDPLVSTSQCWSYRCSQPHLAFWHGSWGPKLSTCSCPVNHLSSPGYLFR